MLAAVGAAARDYDLVLFAFQGQNRSHDRDLQSSELTAETNAKVEPNLASLLEQLHPSDNQEAQPRQAFKPDALITEQQILRPI